MLALRECQQHVEHTIVMILNPGHKRNNNNNSDYPKIIIVIIILIGPDGISNIAGDIRYIVISMDIGLSLTHIRSDRKQRERRIESTAASMRVYVCVREKILKRT